MKLSDIKGERSLDIMADAMELAEIISDDERFKAMVDGLREAKEQGGDITRVFLRHVPPIIRDQRYKSRIVSIMAAASGVPVEEYAESGPLVKDLMELVTSDAESLGFFSRVGSSQGVMWQALGDYRGPKSARAFMRYATARADAADREKSYRLYVTDCLRLAVGANVSYREIVNGPDDFDAGKVVDLVVSKAGLEVIPS